METAASSGSSDSTEDVTVSVPGSKLLKGARHSIILVHVCMQRSTSIARRERCCPLPESRSAPPGAQGFFPRCVFLKELPGLPAMDTGPRATIRVGISMAAFLLGCARSQGVASPRHHPGGSEGLWVLGKPQDRAASAVEAILGV